MSSNYSYDKGLWQTLVEFRNVFIGLLIALLIGVGIYFWIGNSSKGNEVYKFESSWVRPYNVKVGKPDSNVKLVYFYDLQCPACKANDVDLEKVKVAYSEKVEFVYRNMPLTQLHAYAGIAAKGAQAASRQGTDKYFEFKKNIFAVQETLSPDKIETAAKQVVGLDKAQWDKDFKSISVENEVAWDKKDITDQELPESTIIKDGNNKSVTKASGTPTNLVLKDGKIVDWWTGGLSSEKQSAVLNKALAQ